MPLKVSVSRGWGLRPGGVVVHDHQATGIGVEGGGAGEEGGGVAVGAEAEVEHVELAELAHQLVIPVGAVLTAHGVVGVDRPDVLEQRLTDQAVVRVLVVQGHAAFVAPVDVHPPPVDLGAAGFGQGLVAGAGGLAAGEKQREEVRGAGDEGLDDALGELRRHAVHDHQLPEHGPDVRRRGHRIRR